MMRVPETGILLEAPVNGYTFIWDAATRTWSYGPGGGGGGVTSWNGRNGVVIPLSGDYDTDQIINLSTVPGLTDSDALEHLDQTKLEANLANQAVYSARSIGYSLVNDSNLGSTPAIDWTSGANQKGILNTNCAPTFVAPLSQGVSLQLRVQQDATGGRSFTQPVGIIVLGATPTVDQAANAVTFLNYWYDDSTYFLLGDIASQLGPRGIENVVVDLFPSGSQEGTVNTAGSVTADVPVALGRDYIITCKVVVVDGSAAILYAKTLNVWAHQIGGAVLNVAPQTIGFDTAGASFTLTAAGNGTNMRFTLANTSGSNRPYTMNIGFVATDKP